MVKLLLLVIIYLAKQSSIKLMLIKQNDHNYLVLIKNVISQAVDV